MRLCISQKASAPSPSTNNNIQYAFNIEFIVDKNGEISDSRIKGKALNECTVPEIALLKVVEGMPAWIPGQCNKTNVPTLIFLRLSFNYGRDY